MATQDLDHIISSLFLLRKMLKLCLRIKNNVDATFVLAILKEHTKLMLEYNETNLKYLQEHLVEHDETIADLKSELRVQRNDHDALACYNRRKNIKIQGVKYQEGENTNQIVKDMCKLAGREISDSDISTSHRNGNTNTNNEIPPGATTRANNVPDIYVRFVIRNVKTTLYALLNIKMLLYTKM